MLVFSFRKATRLLLTALLAASAVFVVMRLAGDPTLRLLGPDADTDAREILARHLGIDRPIAVQYVSYLSNLLHGDLGPSFRSGRPALEEVLQRVPNTLLLGSLSFVLALCAGCALGIFAALNRGSWIDRALVTFAVAGYAMPSFFFGIMLILVFSLNLGWLPSSGIGTAQHLIMPTATLALGWVGVLARFVRGSVVEVINQPHVLAAEARGLRRTSVILGHVVRNAMIPTVVVSGFAVGAILGGAVVTETVFAWPGVGRLLVSAVSARDLPVVQAIVLLLVVAMCVTNLVADVIVAGLDPRTRGK